MPEFVILLMFVCLYIYNRQTDRQTDRPTETTGKLHFQKAAQNVFVRDVTGGLKKQL